jgi:tetratricopeptide (TPR) repeat protein
MSGTVAALALGAVLLASGGASAEEAFRQANARLLQGDADGAIRGYQELCDQEYVSVPLYYNLGNAYYRSGRIGWAVASYQRALRLAPGDADARHNLEVARSAVLDKIVGAGEEPLLDRIVARLSSRAAVTLFAVPWLALWGLLVARRRAPGWFRSLFTVGAVVSALLATGAGGLLAAKARADLTPLGVVVVKTAPVREGSDPSLRPAFELHEGTSVRVVETEGDFLRVRLPNGLEGWVTKGDLTVI